MIESNSYDSKAVRVRKWELTLGFSTWVDELPNERKLQKCIVQENLNISLSLPMPKWWSRINNKRDMKPYAHKLKNSKYKNIIDIREAENGRGLFFFFMHCYLDITKIVFSWLRINLSHYLRITKTVFLW